MHLIKVPFMTNINFLLVSAQGCLPQGVFQVKGIKTQQVNLVISICALAC